MYAIKALEKVGCRRWSACTHFEERNEHFSLGERRINCRQVADQKSDQHEAGEGLAEDQDRFGEIPAWAKPSVKMEERLSL